jgi:periplasmic protein TonB
MKTKTNSLLIVSQKLLWAVPFTLFILYIFSSCAARNKVASVKPDDDTPFVVVEEMPMFPGGDSTLLQYIAQNTRYPEAAKTKKTEGKVIVRFCVTKAGGIDRVSVIKGVSPELDAEAARVVNSLPPFKPGKQGGKPVNVWYMVPINFALK